ncbi:hypothetical protein BDR26DRAFT_1002485 [Obelidium mucronatum]|nr:hypothetical protein BDR26DRAFT_1002485 [Obelidium mucronatum]
MDAEFVEQIKTSLAPLLKFLAYLEPIHEVLRQQVVGPLNGYTAIVLGIQLILQLRKLFVANGNDSESKDDGNKAAKATASHILVKTEAKIKELEAILMKEPERFVPLALKHSICPSAEYGGSLGSFPRGLMAKELEAYCFDPETKENVVSPVISTKFGYHLVILTKKPDV